MASTTIADSYSTGENNNIQLKLTIQSNQKAKSSVRIEDTPVGSGSFDDSFEVALGKSKELAGNTLYVDTTEADINPDADLVSFTIELTGGPNPFKKTLSQNIAPGTSVFYTAEITFV